MVKEKYLDVLFFMETKLRSELCVRLKKRLSWEGCFLMEPVGKKGGLALWWNSRVKVDFLNYTQRHISVGILEEGENDS